jgi:hypothetical protein
MIMKETMHLQNGHTINVYRCHPADDVSCPDGSYLPIYNTMSDFTGTFYIPVEGTNDMVFEIEATTIDEARADLKERLQPRTWYAVMEDKDDDDWGYGSEDLHQAKEMLNKMRENHPDAYIAVINNDVCTEEIR